MSHSPRTRAQTVHRFFEPVMRTPGLSFGSFFIGVFRALSTMLGPYLISLVILGIEQKDETQFLYYLKLYALLAGAIWLINFFVSRVWRRYHFDEMRTDIYKNELHSFSLLSNNEAEKIGTGKANSIIQKGSDKWIAMINQVFVTYVQSITVVLGTLIWVYITFSLQLFLAFLSVRLIAVAISVYGNRYLKKERADRKKFITEADRRIVRYVMSKFEMLLSNKIVSELAVVDSIFKKLKSFGTRIAIKQIFAVDVIYIAIVVILTYWLWYAGYQVIAGVMLFSEFTLRRLLFARMRGNIENMIFGFTERFDNWTHVEKLRDFHDNPHKIEGYEEGAEFVYTNGDIQIQHLTYGYESEDARPVFADFSLSIQGGKRTALVGASGSGKSTLVKLIAGYLRPDAGTIIIDDQDLRDVSLKSYYQHIGYLTQEPSVFDGSIWENLTYAVETEQQHTASANPLSSQAPLSPLSGGPIVRNGSNRGVFPDKGSGGVYEDDGFAIAIEQRVHEAIKNANCEFVYEFADGLDTEIGERGVRLSGGQRQRLAIAKIFLKNPKILILDEPTSALDSFSEEAITEAMHRLFADRTVIIIAHRLQTVKAADDIIVLGDQIVLERGTHTDLVASGGAYAKMLELQSGF